jgi:hypothetical protein
MSAEEPKSVKEAYIRVDVIDIDTSVGNRNIYIGERCKVVLSTARRGEGRTTSKKADIQKRSTVLRIN